MPAEEITPAIVLRARDYMEADRIVTLLTRDLGKLSGIARGAKVSRRRFERKLELFSHVMLCFKRRPHGQLVFITRAEAADLEQFSLENDLARIALASYMAELADAFTSEEDRADGAYRLLLGALGALSRAAAAPALRQSFELKLLGWAGFGLQFGRCPICGASTPASDAIVFFAAARGGALCARCHRAEEERGGEVGFGLKAGDARALTRLASIDFAEIAPAAAPAGEASSAAADFAEAKRPTGPAQSGYGPQTVHAPAAAPAVPSAGPAAATVLARFIASVLGRRPRSAEFLDSILPTPRL